MKSMRSRSAKEVFFAINGGYPAFPYWGYNEGVSTFSEALRDARSIMDRGAFRDAFARIVDIPVGRPDELFSKIALMADAGIALRDGSMLEYGLYILERHESDILAVPSLSPFFWLNIANLRSNLLSVKEAEGGSRCWYDRTQSAKARQGYAKALESVGANEALKVRILTAHGRLLAGLGRDWEAFALYHEASRLDEEDDEAVLGRLECLEHLAGTAPALEEDLLREIYEVSESFTDEEGPGIDQEWKSLRLKISERLQDDSSEEPLQYPTKTVITETDREHQMVMYSLKNRLYLSPCAGCRRCDRAVGDAAALGAHHALVGGKGAGRYKKMAVIIGRLTERYRAVRAALIDHSRSTPLPDGADHQPHFPEIEGRSPLEPSTAVLCAALAGLPAIMEGMAACIAVFLGRETRGAVRIDHILGAPSAPSAAITGAKNPSIHAFWDLWADGVTGMIEGADLPAIFGTVLTSETLEELCSDPDLLERRTLGLLRWIHGLIGYLISMADRDSGGRTDDPPLWPLQPFVMP